MSDRPGRGPWARLFASAVVQDEGSVLAERGRALVGEGAVGAVDVAAGTLSASVAGCSAGIAAKPVPPRIWAAMTRFARGNERLERAVEGRVQSVHLEHLMTEDWSEPLVPRPYQLGRSCSCDGGRELCEHVAALAYAVAERIDADPSLLLRWRGCVAATESPEEAAVAPSPEPRPLRPLPVGAVLKRLGPSGLRVAGEDLATVLERAYASFSASAD